MKMYKSFIFVAILFATFVFSSNAQAQNYGELEKDVRKLFGYMCEAANLNQQMMSETDQGKQAAIQARFEELGKEAQAFTEKVEAKYPNLEQDLKAVEITKRIMEEEMKKCPALVQMMQGNSSGDDE